jgi:arylsulfatase A-like enzyme
MNCFFAAGPNFRPRYQSETPGGLIDLVPTMLHTLGIAPRETMTGRALTDLLIGGRDTADATARIETASVGEGSYRQHLTLRRLARRNVLQHGWRD